MESDIPDDFSVVPAEEYCERVADGTHDSPKTALSGKKLITSKNIKGGRIVFDGCYLISDEDFHTINKRSKVDQWDIIFTMIGTVGEVALVVDQNPDFAIKNVGLFKPKTEVDSKYLYYFLISPQAKCLYEKTKRGSTQQYMSLRDLRAIPVPVPNDDGLKKSICEMLWAFDQRITLLRETNATLEAIAQALFKSWFVDFDPVRAKAEGREPEGVPPEVVDLFPDELVESELGMIPKGWKPGKLADVAVNYREGVDPTELSEDTPYIGLEHMPRQSIALDAWEGAGKVESGKSRFAEGDILFGKLRPYFHKVGIAPISGICSTDILVIRPKAADWGAFCLCHFASKKLIDYAIQLSNGAKMPRVNWKDVAAYPAAIPTPGLAQAFNELIVPLVTRITANVHQAKSLASLRDTLLPRLMSGKLRITDAEKEVDAV